MDKKNLVKYLKIVGAILIAGIGVYFGVDTSGISDVFFAEKAVPAYVQPASAPVEAPDAGQR